MSNVIIAIKNLTKDPQLKLVEYYRSKNRANMSGDSLEEYVKDLFAGTLKEKDDDKRDKKIEAVFSYTGNNSNPPDAMLFNGDAIEIKKLESVRGEIQLNSSHPKRTLKNSSKSMITKKCAEAEEGKWKEKDLLYIIGNVKKGKLRSMFMIYGIDYAASEKTYLAIKKTLKRSINDGIKELSEIEPSKTKELGKIKKLDPLEIASLRIRPMWTLKNPWKVFKKHVQYDKTAQFEFCAIINEKKYLSFPAPDRDELEKLEKVRISTIKIDDPNKAGMQVDAKMIRYTVS